MLVSNGTMYGRMFTINFGVRQGSVLSLVLFVIYVDDVSKCSKSYYSLSYVTFPLTQTINLSLTLMLTILTLTLTLLTPLLTLTKTELGRGDEGMPERVIVPFIHSFIKILLK